MEMIADSSFLISLFLDTDSRNEEARGMYQKCNERIIVPMSVLEEMFNVLVYKRGIDYAIESIDELLSEKEVEKYIFSDDELEDIIDLIKQRRTKMSIIDYEVAYLANKLGRDILCFDKQVKSLLKHLKKRDKNE